jgi:arylsulfatase A-like enzyme
MIDLLPTAFALLGMQPPALMGQSLTPLFAGRKTERDEPATSELSSWGHNLQSFRRPERKTIWDLDIDAGIVFDLLADPGELAPLQDRSSPIVQAAKGDVQWSRQFLAAFRARYPQSPKISDLPEKLLEKLRSLGYVGEEPLDESDKDAP